MNHIPAESMRYSGVLYFVGFAETLRVDALIVRPDDAAFDIAADSQEHRSWRVQSTAAGHVDGSYHAERMHATQAGRQSIPIDIAFTIKELADTTIDVVGAWTEAGVSYPFDGNLELAPPKR